ncbi:MAG: hypothetical protein IJY55_02895 [Clostridia bacterium]|nr:hypothetical protein [Clostridia bacterium]
MLLSLFFRVLRLMITSILCSLPIYLEYVGTIPDNVILFLSFVAFMAATGIDACRFSSAFWKIQDYYLGQLLPLVIYIIMGFLTCLLFQPVVFNRIFLPLRFAGGFGMRTIESIVYVAITIIIIVTILRFFGARLGRSTHNMFVRENEDI